MEIKSVITRKPISESDHILGLLILGTVDTKRMETIKKPEDDVQFVLQTIGQVDKAAKYLGFSNYNDMIEFVEMFGPESL